MRFFSNDRNVHHGRRPCGGVVDARVFQLSVSQGGVPKTPIPEADVTELGLVGDRHADERHHGGPARAVCLYAQERIEALQKEGHGIFPGALGENITTVGLDWSSVAPGDRLTIGDVLLEVTSYAKPCSTTASFVSFDTKRYHQQFSPGWSRVYARVIRGGHVSVGAAILHMRGPLVSGTSQ